MSNLFPGGAGISGSLNVAPKKHHYQPLQRAESSQEQYTQPKQEQYPILYSGLTYPPQFPISAERTTLQSNRSDRDNRSKSPEPQQPPL